MHEPRLVAKTIVELAFRSSISSEYSTSSGSEADHKKVTRCLDAMSNKGMLKGGSSEVVSLVLEVLHRPKETSLSECNWG